MAALGATIAAGAVTAPTASAFFSAAGTGQVQAAVGSVRAPTAVATVQTGAAITVSWAAATRGDGGPVSGYTVTRSDGTTVCGTASSPIIATSCVDSDPPSGTYTYAVTAIYHDFTASARSAAATVLLAPVISSSPSAQSASTSPTFSFSGGQGSGYQCSLDSAAYSACTSPEAVSGLSSGSHTLSIRAVSGSSTGPVTTYAWTVDPAAPTILSSPTNPTSSASATFTFSDAESSYTFLCSIGGGAFSACTSPQSYAALSDGTHVFAVQARSPDGSVTGQSSFTWVSDTTPAAATITFPAAGGYDNSSGFTAGCNVSPFSAADTICGHATDSGTGVKQVLVSIQQGSGDYWNGSAFSSATEVKLAATGTANWTLPFTAALPDGTYTVRAYGVDNVGNTQTTPAVASYTLDNTAPAPTIASVNGGGLVGLSSLLSLASFAGACGKTTGDTPVVNWTVTQTVGGSVVQSGNTACTAGSYTVTLGPTLTALLGYTITITQTDQAGNTGTATQRVVVV